jgi:hypothetical protein
VLFFSRSSKTVRTAWAAGASSRTVEISSTANDAPFHDKNSLIIRRMMRFCNQSACGKVAPMKAI